MAVQYTGVCFECFWLTRVIRFRRGALSNVWLVTRPCGMERVVAGMVLAARLCLSSEMRMTQSSGHGGGVGC